MARLQMNLQTVSPLFMAGANPKVPEVRAASFRGLLRYWLRAVLGVGYQQDYAGLKQRESHYWGSTSQGSALRLVVDKRPRRDPQEDRYVILPPTFQNGSANRLAAFPVESTFELRLDTLHPHRAASLFTDELYASLLLAFWVGGAGKRARRGGGALRVDSVEGDASSEALHWLTYLPQDGADAARHLQDVIYPYVRSTAASSATPTTQAFGHYPDYTVMLPNYVFTFVGDKSYVGSDAYLDALKQMWQMTGPYHHDHNSPWGYARGRNRRASVVHMRVVLSELGWHPMVTFLLAGRPGENWARINQAIDVFRHATDFIPVTY